MRRWPERRDALVAAALGGYGVIEVLVPGMPGVGDAPGEALVSATAALGIGAAAAWRRRAPLPGLAAAVTALGLEAALTTPAEGLGPLLAELLLVFGVGSREPLTRAVLGLVVLVGVSSAASGDPVFVLVLFGSAWLAGRVLGDRQRALAVAEERGARLAREAEQAVAEERARISRELHDVVSHALTVVVLQAQAAEAHLHDEAAARASLVAVKRAGQQALGDMRRMLGLLEAPTSTTPQPDLGRLPELLRDTRAAGLPVVLEQTGSPSELPPTLSLTAYRVVQEALTNVLKHAGACPTVVHLGWEPGELRLDVRNEGEVVTTREGGHGLVGMRERVALFGGHVTAEPLPAGGFRVTALLPLPVPARR